MKAGEMKATLKRYAERIDAATLHERVGVFLAAACVLIFIAYITVLAPMQARQKQAAAQNEQRQAELRTLQAELQRLARAAELDPNAPVRKREAALRAELAQLNARLAQEHGRFTPPERMRALLSDMLERHRGLALVDLRTIAPAAIGESAPSAPGVFRHGIEITLSGRYLDFYDYLQALERLPNQIYWGRAELSVAEYPQATLKITVYTLSFDRAWLIV
jgi:MSHA biogenesis protein MshJ